MTDVDKAQRTMLARLLRYLDGDAAEVSEATMEQLDQEFLEVARAWRAGLTKDERRDVMRGGR